jgi:hypothetical protein
MSITELARVYREAIAGIKFKTKAVTPARAFTDNEVLRIHQIGNCAGAQRLVNYFKDSPFKLSLQQAQQVIATRCDRCFGRPVSREFFSFRIPNYSE